jgi:UDP-galactopyranose mutase
MEVNKKSILRGTKTAYDIVIVGAGISGLTLAERYSSLGKSILVVESRNHIGGNCYDYLNDDGILVSKYGPHYFHTNDDSVWDYVQQFSKWRPYEHRVIAHIDNKEVPIPINIKTVNMLFNLSIETEEEMKAWLKDNVPIIPNPQNAEEAAIARVGQIMYEKIFKSYTKKQWGMDPINLDPEVTNRIPVRTNDDNRYFTDKYQALPKHGYTKLFEKMIKGRSIEVVLNTPWDEIKDYVNYSEKLFFTGRIDSYFHKKFGALEYRSLRFEFETLNQEHFQEFAQENYPSENVPFTRIVEYKIATGQKNSKTTISKEFPTWEGDPYYPVLSKRNQELYKKYQLSANELEKNNVYFVGRLANYKYFNMDQAFKNALDFFHKIEGHF